MIFLSIPSSNVIRQRMMMSPRFASFSCSSTSKLTTVIKKPKPWLFIGLGNPGEIFRGTRHNAGFEMLDALAEAEGISMSNVSFNALIGKGNIGNVPVIFAKPQTTMNFSGDSVESIVSHYKIPLEQVLVIYDDFRLPFATLSLKPKGGPKGHNGMRSVIDHLERTDLDHLEETDLDFPRLRIGLGAPPEDMFIGDFVLGRFDKKEREELDFIFQKGVDGLRMLLLMGFAKAAQFTNTESWKRGYRDLIKLRTLLANLTPNKPMKRFNVKGYL